VADFQSTARPHVEALLEPGEELRGIAAATQQSLFKGRMVALVATDRRLMVVPLTRKLEPEGEPLLITREEIAAAKSEGAGGGWWTATAPIMDAAAVTLKLRTTGGEKLKLSMMREGGAGPLGKLAGGEGQKQGVEAVAEWFRRA
jgi:hypothetical protein